MMQMDKSNRPLSIFSLPSLAKCVNIFLVGKSNHVFHKFQLTHHFVVWQLCAGGRIVVMRLTLMAIGRPNL